ncbi:MAG: adenylosuccinate lyase [Candidatus Eisenbacteria bacterium]|nr:adenylosuccinate lyase [Candidatus Eisenbacteria bacterium]
MIARYTRPEMGALFSDEHRFATWLRVEIAQLEILEEMRMAPAGTAAAVREKAQARPSRILELEETLHHDVIAFLTSVGEELGPEKKWLHYGMTSSDLVDTAQALVLDEAVGKLLAAWEGLGSILRDLATRHRRLPMVGRTHGVHAEPITFGFKLLGWFAEAERQARRLEEAREGIGFGKLSGAVGTAAHLPPDLEKAVLLRLGLKAEPVATQVVPRDRHAHLLSVLAGMGGSCERWALEVRHLQRTEVRELEEPFGKGQKGSSAMPHKRNPILCERIAGLARLLRGYALVGLENVPLWHERDISHSSAERVVFADSCTVLDYMIDRMRFVLANLGVRPDAMRRNLEATGGLIFSQKVLLALTEAWGDRERAYRRVQEHAMAAWEEGDSFRERLLADGEVLAVLGAGGMERLFDVESFYAHLDPIFDRVLSSAWGRG